MSDEKKLITAGGGDAEEKMKEDQTVMNPEQVRQEVSRLLEKVPELKQLMEELGKEAAEKIESVFTRATLLTNTTDPDQLYMTVMDMLIKAGIELQSKYWPKLVDLIRENDEVAEVIKKTGADISSLAGTLGIMFSTILPHYANVFISGGIATTLQMISMDTQNMMSALNQKTNLEH